MSVELKRLIHGQLQRLRQLVDDHQEGVDRILRSAPDLWEREALVEKTGPTLDAFDAAVRSFLDALEPSQ